MVASIFLDFRLPNSASWFYFSFFLTLALFFQFNRVFSLRNWDLLALFLFTPGFLLVQEANQLSAASASPADPAGWDLSDRAVRERVIGYVWLLAACAFWFTRCIVDLGVGRRPPVTANLNMPGLLWFGGALFLCLAAVAFSRPEDPWTPVGRRPAVLSGVEQGAASVFSQAQTGTNGPPTAEALFYVSRSFAVLGHAVVVAGLIFLGWRHFRDLPTGVAAGGLYLLVPYAAYHFGQVHHVWPAALMLWAVFAFNRPTLAGALLGLAVGIAFFPLALLPVWCQFFRGRGIGRFLGGFCGAAILAGAATILSAYLTGGYNDATMGGPYWPDWVPGKAPAAEGIWAGAHWAYRLPVFIAYAGFVLTTWLWPPVRNVGQLVAVSAAVLIGIQFWFADRGGQYVLWFAPLLIIVVLRPNLTDLQPESPGPWPKVFGYVYAKIRRVPLEPVPPALAS